MTEAVNLEQLWTCLFCNFYEATESLLLFTVASFYELANTDS